MMNPKFIEHDEDVVILTKSEYDNLQAELADTKAKLAFQYELGKTVYRMANKDESMSKNDFFERVGI
ncbi:hypothetical protein RyT2_26460 [Pseudolactococcus yaeyamensis]